MIVELNNDLILRTPPPRVGFFVGWFPNQEPRGRGLPLKNNPNFLGKLSFFSGGSSSSGLLVWKPTNKETPAEGGGFLQSDCRAEE